MESTGYTLFYWPWFIRLPWWNHSQTTHNSLFYWRHQCHFLFSNSCIHSLDLSGCLNTKCHNVHINWAYCSSNQTSYDVSSKHWKRSLPHNAKLVFFIFVLNSPLFVKVLDQPLIISSTSETFLMKLSLANLCHWTIQSLVFLLDLGMIMTH